MKRKAPEQESRWEQLLAPAARLSFAEDGSIFFRSRAVVRKKRVPAMMQARVLVDSGLARPSASSKRNSLAIRRRRLSAQAKKHASADSISMPVFHYWQVQMKSRAVSRFALHANSPAVQLDRAV